MSLYVCGMASPCAAVSAQIPTHMAAPALSLQTAVVSGRRPISAPRSTAQRQTAAASLNVVGNGYFGVRW